MTSRSLDLTLSKSSAHPTKGSSGNKIFFLNFTQCMHSEQFKELEKFICYEKGWGSFAKKPSGRTLTVIILLALHWILSLKSVFENLLKMFFLGCNSFVVYCVFLPAQRGEPAWSSQVRNSVLLKWGSWLRRRFKMCSVAYCPGSRWSDMRRAANGLELLH